MIKAIETHYKGYRFRSRLEARWAVFFDALGIQWEYEKEGYDLGEAGWYLPDFWLPEVNMYVEIKPEIPLSSAELLKIAAIKKSLGKNRFHVLRGIPVTFKDDDRDTRFESHLNQMIVCTCISVAMSNSPQGAFSIENYRTASAAARSARFEHGETPL